jgi:glycerophosphoryl diester phosphodiesterase
MNLSFLVLLLFLQSIEGALGQARPLICGHRGGFYADYPENSLAAIGYTGRGTASPIMVEFDLRRSKEGTLFLMHDQTVDRTTNGHGNIAELSDDYVSSLFLKRANGELSGEKIPSYEDLLRFVETRNILLMFDAKGDVWPEAIQRLTERKLLHKSMFLTFTPADTQKVYSLSEDVRISFLVKTEKDWESVRNLSIPTQKLIAYMDRNAAPDLITQIRKSGIPVMADVSENAGGRNSPFPAEYYVQLVEKMKLDILITDYPIAAFSAFRR